MKREEVENDLDIFCPKCRKKHEKNDFPLDTMEVYEIYADKHPTKKFPFPTPLKYILRGEAIEEHMEPLCYMCQRREFPFRP